jgi:uncharacterized protein
MASLNTLGFGLGLRPRYYPEILDTKPRVDWFEVITENFLVAGGKPLAMLDRIRTDYPVVMHGVSLSVASTASLDFDYLRSVKDLFARIEPAWVSDHLCWTGVHGVNLHDLLPIPYTFEALGHVVERILRVQDVLKRRLVIENVSTYLSCSFSEMSEQDFIVEMVRRADCRLLLDVNNVHVSSFNHSTSAEAFVDALPIESVIQLHLAGHSHLGGYKIDSHDQDVSSEVWELYARAWRRFGPVATMIERDDNFPPFERLLAELQRARAIAAAQGTGELAA